MTEIKNMLERTKSGLDEAKDQINELEDNIDKECPFGTTTKKGLKKWGQFKGTFGTTWSLTKFASQGYQKKKKERKVLKTYLKK